MTALLISMPWETLFLPSIQLGTLRPILQRGGIETEVWTMKLDFMEHLIRETADAPEEERIGVQDYQALAVEFYGTGAGEWVFAVPPFRPDDPASDASLLTRLVERMGEPLMRRVVKMRQLVPSFIERYAREILARQPSLVGFTSTFSQNVAALVMSKRLKELAPSLPIVFGGANCDGPMGAALHRSFSWVDAVVRGEAERVVVPLFEDLLAGRPPRRLPGLCVRDEEGRSHAVAQTADGLVAMSEVPPPDYDEFFDRLPKTSFYAEVAYKVRILYESARGCWWGEKAHCTFCGLNGTSMAFRSKEPARAAREMLDLAERHQLLDFQVVDNIIDMKYVREAMPTLRAAGIDLSVFYETKSNLKREQIAALRDAGVDELQPGIESLSTPILELMRKGVTAFHNIRLLKSCALANVGVHWNLLYGFPGEPPEEYERMAEVMRSLTHLYAPMFVKLVVTRFSPYFESAEQLGVELLGPRPHYREVYPVDDSTLGDLAYAFTYRHKSGRDPESYVGPARKVIEEWQKAEQQGPDLLRYRRGPGFVSIRDRRPNLEGADYVLEREEGALYLACEDGATVEAARNAVRAQLGRAPDAGRVRDFLDSLVELRLMYAEAGRYLSLALPTPAPSAAARLGLVPRETPVASPEPRRRTLPLTA